jgi:hypothetical protein
MDNPDNQEPTTVTILKGSVAMPDAASELQTGDSVMLKGEVSANDENGLTITLNAPVEKADEDETERPPNGDGEVADEIPPTGDDDSPTSGATDYVKSKRRAMMSE